MRLSSVVDSFVRLRPRRLAAASLLAALALLVVPAASLGQAGTTWTGQTAAAANDWRSVTYGNGLFVAVSETGTGNRVMTSTDGATWTSRTSAADNEWRSVTFGNGVFVAVSGTGTGNRVMTSPDGITWTSQSSAPDSEWNSITFGNGTFVAVAASGMVDRVMTSTDGVNWTGRTAASNTNFSIWNSVTYGNGLFVAVAEVMFGSSSTVMTSPDGVNWTSQSAAAPLWWKSVTYGDGLFVAVAASGTTNRVMTSPDGITWTSRTAPTGAGWMSVTYGNGLFVAVGFGGNSNRTAMTSETSGGVVPPAPAPQPNPANRTPVLQATVLPSRSTLVSGQPMRVGIRARNTGGGTAESVTSCVTVPSNLVITSAPGARRSGRTACFSMGAVAAGTQATRVVNVRAVGLRPTRVSVRGSVRATGLAAVIARSTSVRITPRPVRARVAG
jgi:hypothetical protein